jgi:hypothetical protein
MSPHPLRSYSPLTSLIVRVEGLEACLESRILLPGVHTLDNTTSQYSEIVLSRSSLTKIIYYEGIQTNKGETKCIVYLPSL